MNRFVRPAALVAAYGLTVFAQYRCGHYLGADIAQKIYPHDHLKEPGMLQSPLFWAVFGYFALAGFLYLVSDLVPVEQKIDRRDYSFVVSLVLSVTAFIGVNLYQNLAGWVIVIVDVVALPFMLWRIWAWLTNTRIGLRQIITKLLNWHERETHGQKT